MKPNFLKSFLICWLLIFSKGSYSQKKFSNFLENERKIDYGNSLTPVRPLAFPQVISPISGKEKLEIVRGDFYVRGLGIVCRNEWKMDKLMPVRLRFRLGSLDYVNKIEGKKL